MFTIFGANGNTGSIVASRLLDRGAQVRVFARDAAKLEALRARGAEVVTGDVTDARAVAAALAGAEGAYLMCPPDNASPDLIGRGRKILEGYAAGLAAAKVPHAVVLSSLGAQQASGTGPIVITHLAEKLLPQAGAALTFLRPAYFMENILANAWPMKQDGVLPVFGGGEGYPFPMVATRDIGDVAAEALLAPRPGVIELSGPRAYSLVDAAGAATAILGRPVKAVALPLENLVPTLTGFGFSANVAELYREMTAAFGAGLGFEGTHRSLAGKVTLEEVLRAGLA